VPGTSENIRVTSIVDRFLEHARIFYFENAGKREVYLSSADWMPRNFQRRVEVMFPVDDEDLRDRVVDEILAVALADNVKARRLLADGTYERVRPEGGAAPMRSQYRFMELAREKAQAGPGLPGAGGGPYQVRTTPPPRGLPSAGSGQAASPVSVSPPSA
jgi:polyphosphate kinase